MSPAWPTKALMEGNIVVIDNVSGWLRSTIDNAPNWKRKALKSTGWFMQKQIKAGIRSGAPGGQQYAKTMPNNVRRDIERAFGHETKSRYPVLGKQAQAVGYQYNTNDSVETGWLSASAAMIGSVAESGGTRTVTEKMKTVFATAGHPIGKKSVIVIPERPTFGPMYRVLNPQIQPYMEKKIFDYVEKGDPGASNSTRKYVVFK